MALVKRFSLFEGKMHQDPYGPYCLAGDAAEHEKAILRRESLLKEKLADCEKSEAALREELANLGTYNYQLNAQYERMCESHLAAEQRNADAVELLQRILDSQSRALMDITVGDIRAFLKPTESGASE